MTTRIDIQLTLACGCVVTSSVGDMRVVVNDSKDAALPRFILDSGHTLYYNAKLAIMEHKCHVPA